MPTILTQFAFDTDPVLAWIDAGARARHRQHDPHRHPGPAGIKRLLGFARRFGIGANAMIVKKYGFSLTNLMGTAGPDKFVTDLSALLARQGRRRSDRNDGRAGEAALLHVRRPARDVRLGARLLARPVLTALTHDRAQRSPARSRLPDRPRP